MEPLFFQRWNLFAPEPQTKSISLIYRCGVDGIMFNWKDPANFNLEKHQKLRIFYHGKVVFAFGALARDLYNHTVESNALIGEKKINLIQTEAYQNTKKEVQRLCRAENKINNRLQFAVVVSYPINFSERATPNKREKITTYPYESHEYY
jgi:hypothetical protein